MPTAPACSRNVNLTVPFPAKRLTLYRQPTSLVVCETKLPPAKPSFEDSVLLKSQIATALKAEMRAGTNDEIMQAWCWQTRD